MNDDACANSIRGWGGKWRREREVEVGRRSFVEEGVDDGYLDDDDDDSEYTTAGDIWTKIKNEFLKRNSRILGLIEPVNVPAAVFN